ncbi:hypothetical protein [Thermofilum adornatum]|uniref:hypothetical protein n=1 Tax=Thermofilum adornatum TaxID=1365176 RepID=UPI0011E57D07|nr:hypothetical protein [Thermofilum adornatum]
MSNKAELHATNVLIFIGLKFPPVSRMVTIILAFATIQTYLIEAIITLSGKPENIFPSCSSQKNGAKGGKEEQAIRIIISIQETSGA